MFAGKNRLRGELYLQYTASESFGFDDGRLKTADFNTQAGFALRGVSGETTAFAQANELSEGAIRRAAETMAVLDPSKAHRPGPPRRTPRPLRRRRRRPPSCRRAPRSRCARFRRRLPRWARWRRLQTPSRQAPGPSRSTNGGIMLIGSVYRDHPRRAPAKSPSNVRTRL